MKIGFVSLGCPKNLVDSEVMIGLSERDGHEITADPRDADVLVVNTCAFIGSAKQESINAILEMAEHKKSGRCRKLVVTGCLAERYREELQREIPEIDVMLGTGEVPQITSAVAANPADAGFFTGIGSRAGDDRRIAQPLTLFRKPAATPAPSLPTYLYDADTPRHVTTPRHLAYIKIAEGCDYKCSFCIIPKLRGPYRSRPIESIVREARHLAESGVKELILVSQDTSFYGVDRGDRGALARLLRQLDRVDGIEWVRLLYLYPTTVHDDVLDAMAACDKVCKYVDLPLQHASDDVLKRMRRPGTRRTYDRLLERVRARVPGVTLRTTFIVGFPGETAGDFDELEDFVASTRFDHVGVFEYSHEEGTTAFKLDDDVPRQVRRERRARLMRLQRGIVGRANRARRGETVALLVDGPSPQHELVMRGRTEGQAPEIDSAVYLTDCGPDQVRAGDLVRAQIVGSRGYDLVARPLLTPGAI